jgi:hypothetical protein
MRVRHVETKFRVAQSHVYSRHASFPSSGWQDNGTCLVSKRMRR